MMKGSKTMTRVMSLIAVCLVLISSNVANAGAIISADGEPLFAGVLTGPCGLPGAVGPTGINDDFTNLSTTKGTAGVPAGGLTTAAGTLVFRNMIENVGNTDDNFVITAPSVPDAFTIEISNDDGANYVLVQPGKNGITLPLASHAAATFFVRITAPAGLKVLTGFDTVIRATSTVMPTASNDTINRLYTGFVRLEGTKTITNSTGVGGPTEAVAGSEIEFTITYSNVSSADGDGSSLLTARNIVIYENGNAAANNWGSTTEHIVGASDNQGGIIRGDHPGSTSLSDLVTSLAAGQSGVFKFKRRIK